MATVTGLTAEKMLELSARWDELRFMLFGSSGSDGQLSDLEIALAENRALLDELNNVHLVELQQDLLTNTAVLSTLNNETMPQLDLELTANVAALGELDTRLVQAESEIASIEPVDLGPLQADITSLNGMFPVTETNISDGAITTPKMTVGTINGDRITTNTLHANRIVAFSISADEIAANAITAAKILAGQIITGHMTANAINGDRITGNTFHGDKIIGNTIWGDRIIANTMSGDTIIGNTFHGDKIISNTIHGDKIVANTIWGDRIIANTMNADRLTANTIQAAIVNAGAIHGITIDGATIRSAASTSSKRIIISGDHNGEMKLFSGSGLETLPGRINIEGVSTFSAAWGRGSTSHGSISIESPIISNGGRGFLKLYASSAHTYAELKATDVIINVEDGLAIFDGSPNYRIKLRTNTGAGTALVFHDNKIVCAGENYNSTTATAANTSAFHAKTLSAWDGIFLEDLNGQASSAANINASGRIVRDGSSRKFKERITSMTLAEAQTILGMRPVTFKWRPEMDMGSDTVPGFIAEETAEAGANLWVTRDVDGSPRGVRYSELTPALLMLVKDLTARVEALEA